MTNALPALDLLLERGVIGSLDYHFAHTLARLAPGPEEVALSAALASRAIQLGHVCVDLGHLAIDVPTGEDGSAPPFEWPSRDRLLGALRASPLASDGSQPTPLVLDARGRLYLQRYESYERRLAQSLLARARRVEQVDLELLAQGLERLFPPPSPEPGGAPPRDGSAQRLAACVAALHHLAVICGGPGTGKTTTVVKLLALLQEQALVRGGSPLEILLLAPTGKAARRLEHAVSSGLAQLPVSDAVRAAIPARAATIHRALWGQRRLGGRFGHDETHPLSAQVVVVDEVSMVDLALLYRLVSAVRPDARLILQGDKDQLASVEAGAILGDIYDARAAHAWSPELVATLRRLTEHHPLPASDSVATARPPLGDCLVSLEESYRYGAESAVGRLARTIKAGDAAAALRELAGGGRAVSGSECRLFGIEPQGRGGISEAASLWSRAIAGYTPFIRAVDPREKLARLGDYRILCAHRHGARGVDAINAGLEARLAEAGLIRKAGAFYENRPIIVTENDYALGLFNGDIGVVAKDEADRLRVCFESPEGLRWLSPGRLPPHETVFATTIHKSQGSEFDAVAVVLPEAASPLLGRELIYTAVTRARRSADVYARADVLSTAIGRGVTRASGLGERLHGAP